MKAVLNWLGPCIQSLPPLKAQSPFPLYLTFDDGPHPECTEAVLKILARHCARATFFVVAEKAQKAGAQIAAMQEAGHAIGNHSLDHRFAPFFASRAAIKDWIARSETLLTGLLGEPPVGFRSPAGVRTPPLHWALRELKLPLIHWNIRFFDTVKPWTAGRARRSLKRTSPGSIVLLHDTHEGERQKTFLATLDQYLTEATKQGFVFEAITRKLLKAQTPS